MKSILEIVNDKVTSPNFKRNAVAKEVFTCLEAGQVTVTQQVKKEVYKAIDKKIKTLLPIGGNWQVVSVIAGHRLTPEGEVIGVGRITTDDKTTVRTLAEELRIATDLYVAIKKKLQKKESDSLTRQLRRAKNAIITRVTLLRWSKHPEEVTMAANFEKWIKAEDEPAIPVKTTPEVLSVVSQEEIKPETVAVEVK